MRTLKTGEEDETVSVAEGAIAAMFADVRLVECGFGASRKRDRESTEVKGREDDAEEGGRR